MKNPGFHVEDEPADRLSDAITIETATLQQLLDLRAEIDTRLPATALKNLNLEEELVIQFQVVKQLQTTTLASNEESNKKAQVANTCAGVLQQLIRMQTEFHTAERLKNIESRLIKSLEVVPDKYLKEFFDWYESEGNPE